MGIAQGQSAAAVAPFARAHGVRYPVLLDIDQRYGTLYATVGLPTTVLVGRDGKVVRVIDGAVDARMIAALVDPLLGRR